MHGETSEQNAVGPQESSVLCVGQTMPKTIYDPERPSAKKNNKKTNQTPTLWSSLLRLVMRFRGRYKYSDWKEGLCFERSSGVQSSLESFSQAKVCWRWTGDAVQLGYLVITETELNTHLVLKWHKSICRSLCISLHCYARYFILRSGKCSKVGRLTSFTKGKGNLLWAQLTGGALSPNHHNSLGRAKRMCCSVVSFFWLLRLSPCGSDS